jgi:hypothetical protein
MNAYRYLETRLSRRADAASVLSREADIEAAAGFIVGYFALKGTGLFPLDAMDGIVAAGLLLHQSMKKIQVRGIRGQASITAGVLEEHAADKLSRLQSIPDVPERE